MKNTATQNPAKPARILQLGDPGLRRRSLPVDDVNDRMFRYHHDRLHATLAAFRDGHGFGRAIAAPQIGVARRFIAVNLGDGPFTLINPEITWKSADTFTMWDDCMSFPDLLVRLRRHCSISVRYLDASGTPGIMARLDRAMSELLQHEIDHLDGVLAVDRALDARSLASREAFDACPERFAKLVDYVIG